MRSADCQFSGLFNFQIGNLIELFFTDQGGWLAPVGTLWYSQSGTLGCWYLQLFMEESIVTTTPESIDVASGSDPTQRHRQWLVRTIASRFEHWLAVHGKFRETQANSTHANVGHMPLCTCFEDKCAWRLGVRASGAKSQSNNNSRAAY